MPQEANLDGINFIKELEERRGAPIGYRTFSTFYADTDGNIRLHGVFLYEAGGRFWYRDFDNEINLLGFKIKKWKDKPEYEMFESSFSPLDVVSCRKVTKSAAHRCVMGGKPFKTIKAANPFLSFFCETVTEFQLADGRALYFQLIDKTVQNLIEKAKNENK